MTQIVTVQPSLTVSGYPTTAGFTYVGAASAHACVNDNSDATYVEWDNAPGHGGELAFGFPTPSLPADPPGRYVESLQLRLRRRAVTGSGQNNPFWWYRLLMIGNGFYDSALHFINMGGEHTQQIPVDSAIHDSYTSQISYLDDGSHVRDMLMTTPNIFVSLGTFPTNSSVVRLYKVELLIRYNEWPTVAIGANPPDPASSSRPIVGWTYSDPDGETQQSARLIVVPDNTQSLAFPYAMAGTPFFRPEAATTISYDSGEVYGAFTQLQVGPGLVNGNRYWACVRVKTTPSTGLEQASRWYQKAFTVTATPTANPTFAITADQVDSRVHLFVRESSHSTPHPVRYTIERLADGDSDWRPVRGATDTATARGFRLAGQAFNGWSTPDRAGFDFTNGLTVRWRGALTDYTPSANNTIVSQSLSTGNQRSWVFRVKTDGKLELMWSTAGTSHNIVATSTVATGATDDTEQWFEARLTANTNPWSCSFWKSSDGVTWVQVGTTVTGAGPQTLFNSTEEINISGFDNHLFDQISGVAMQAWVWTQAGTAVVSPSFYGQAPKTTSFVDAQGNTWTYNSGPDGYLEMEIDIYDYEAPLGVDVAYEVQAWRDDTDIVAGPWVASTPAEVQLSGAVWRLKNPLAPELNMTVTVVELRETGEKPMTVSYSVDSVNEESFVSHTGVRGATLQFMFRTLSKATFDELRAAWRSGLTLLLQSVLGRQWYVQFGQQTQFDVLHAAPNVGETFPIRHAYEISGQLIEVQMPADI